MKDKFVKVLLKEEMKAYEINEIPVGAIIVKDDKIICRAHNLKEKQKNVLKHAELIAIEKAAKKNGDWRLNDCILYTSLFPCPMCAAAIQQSRIKKIVYINDDVNIATKNISLQLLQNKNLNHRVEIEKIRNDKSLLMVFFKKIRVKENVSRETLNKK